MRPISQSEVEAAVVRVAHELEIATDDYAGLCETAAKTDVTYKRDRAMAMVELVGKAKTVDERDARAFIATCEAYEAMRFAEAVRDACDQKLRNLRAVLSARQTLLRVIRDQT